MIAKAARKKCFVFIIEKIKIIFVLLLYSLLASARGVRGYYLALLAYGLIGLLDS
jgi:hypothetical protein